MWKNCVGHLELIFVCQEPRCLIFLLHLSHHLGAPSWSRTSAYIPASYTHSSSQGGERDKKTSHFLLIRTLFSRDTFNMIFQVISYWPEFSLSWLQERLWNIISSRQKYAQLTMTTLIRRKGVSLRTNSACHMPVVCPLCLKNMWYCVCEVGMLLTFLSFETHNQHTFVGNNNIL